MHCFLPKKKEIFAKKSCLYCTTENIVCNSSQCTKGIAYLGYNGIFKINYLKNTYAFWRLSLWTEVNITFEKYNKIVQIVECSNWIESVSFGVPEGSIFGPLCLTNLFDLYYFVWKFIGTSPKIGV